jgi:uncharacterized protein (TIGR02217 family)
MTNQIYPVLPGRAWPITRTAIYKTDKHEAVSGRELCIARWAYARYRFGLTYDVLRESLQELQAVAGLFGACKGSFDTFLWKDPDPAFSVATSQQFGVGDGVTTKFQLARSYASQFMEPVAAVVAGASIFVNGLVNTNNTVSAMAGFVTFGTPPAMGATLTWSGTYYWRCRFDSDELTADQFMKDLWNGKVQFISKKV